MEPDDLLVTFGEVATGVRSVLDEVDDWYRPGDRPGQYGFDLTADALAVEILTGAGLGVLSEESGLHHPERDVVVVIDPVDGSTNASRGIPWFATSLAAIDGDGLLASMVVNQASGVRYTAVRGQGAERDGHRLAASRATGLEAAMVAVNGYPALHLGWAQYRAFGAAALDLCLVADGRVDAYVDCADSNHGCWDYLGAMLVVEEAGGVIADLDDRDMVVLDHDARRAPVAAGTAPLREALAAARRAAR